MSEAHAFTFGKFSFVITEIGRGQRKRYGYVVLRKGQVKIFEVARCFTPILDEARESAVRRARQLNSGALP